MYLLVGYPAILVGLVAGFVAQRRGWRIAPVLVFGAAIAVALVVRQPTMQGHNGSAEGAYTPWIWELFGVVNVGCWALGVAMGVAVAEKTRRARRI